MPADLIYDGVVASLSAGLTIAGAIFADMAFCGKASLPSGASAPTLVYDNNVVGLTFDGNVAALATGLNVSGPIYADSCFFGGTAYPGTASPASTSATHATIHWDGTIVRLNVGLNVTGPLYATACYCGGVEYPTTTTYDGVLNCGDGAGAAVWNPRITTGGALTAGNWIPSGVPDATTATQIDGTIGYDQFATTTTEVTVGSDVTVNSLRLTAGDVVGQGDVVLTYEKGASIQFAIYDTSIASACSSGVTLADLAAR
jgi:hypothetical protein